MKRMTRNDAICLERTIADAWDEEYGNGRHDGESLGGVCRRDSRLSGGMAGRARGVGAMGGCGSYGLMMGVLCVLRSNSNSIFTNDNQIVPVIHATVWTNPL